MSRPVKGNSTEGSDDEDRHFGVTAHQVARAESLCKITGAEMMRGGLIDLCAYLQEFWKNDI